MSFFTFPATSLTFTQITPLRYFSPSVVGVYDVAARTGDDQAWTAVCLPSTGGEIILGTFGELRLAFYACDAQENEFNYAYQITPPGFRFYTKSPRQFYSVVPGEPTILYQYADGDTCGWQYAPI